MKMLLVDCDGVLLNFSEGFPQYLNKTYPELKIDVNQWDFGISKEDFYKYINEFNTTPDFAKMPALRDSVEYVKKLAYMGYKFVAISTCLGNEYTKILREKNLQDVFGNVFEEVICLPIGSSKLQALQQFKPTYWCDDKLKHCQDGKLAGHISFEMIHDYNVDDIYKDESYGIIPVRSWKKIYDYVVAKENP